MLNNQERQLRLSQILFQPYTKGIISSQLHSTFNVINMAKHVDGERLHETTRPEEFANILCFVAL